MKSPLTLWTLTLPVMLLAALPGQASWWHKRAPEPAPTHETCSVYAADFSRRCLTYHHVEMTRTITPDQLGRAHEMCFATGDRAHGIPSLVQKIYEGLFQGNHKATSIRLNRQVSNGSLGFMDDVALVKTAQGVSLSAMTMQFNLDALALVFNRDARPLKLDSTGRFSSRGDVALISATILPSFVGAPKVVDSYAAPYGTLASEVRTISDLTVSIPIEGTALHFTNAVTDQPADFTADSQVYLDCMQSELGLRIDPTPMKL